MLRAHEPTMPSDGWVPNDTKAPHEPQHGPDDQGAGQADRPPGQGT